MPEDVQGIVQQCTTVFAGLDALSEEDRIEAINQIRQALHDKSPMKDEPIDCVLWVPASHVQANDYNPNSVAPPEMSLLRHSIECDGYTQPIVTFPEGDQFTVIDGFHRNRIGKEDEEIHARCRGRLPITRIRPGRSKRNERISATIRHNRARGKHGVDAMSKIVIELAKRNWSDKKISKELGMDEDEVLRLKQVTGLIEAFADREFSEAWEAEQP